MSEDCIENNCREGKKKKKKQPAEITQWADEVTALFFFFPVHDKYAFLTWFVLKSKLFKT